MRKTFLRRVCASFMVLSFVLTQSGGGAGLNYQARAIVVEDSITSPTSGYATNLYTVHVYYVVDGVPGDDIVDLSSEGANTINRGTASITVYRYTQTPVITINGENPVEISVGEEYNDAGAEITGSADPNIEIQVDEQVNTAVVGNDYTVTYNAVDAAGNEAETKIRNVHVIGEEIVDDTDTDEDGIPDVSDTDDDNDGIFDEGDPSDNCPLTENFGQEDLDGDGIGDECDSDGDGDGVVNAEDNCAWDANADQTDTDGDSIGDACDNNNEETDTDNDGIFDEGDPRDNCPLDSNSQQEDLDGDGIGDVCDTDDDNDEVADTTDNCLLISNTSQEDIDSDGIGDACDETDDREEDSNDDNSSNGGGAAIILAKFAPLNASIMINSGNEKTAIRNVALALSAENAEMMAIANDSGFADSSWEIYNPSKEWTLTEGNGIKTVYAKFKNASGTDSKIYTDEITLDGNGSDDDGSVLGDDTVGIYNGDLIQCKASADPGAVYVVKIVGNKKFIRHIKSDFFKFYKDIVWSDVKEVASLDEYTVSKWVRINTDINGTAKPTDKVYEINGDWTKHWLNMTTEQFFARGGSEEAIFNINQGELDSYTAGADVL